MDLSLVMIKEFGDNPHSFTIVLRQEMQLKDGQSFPAIEVLGHQRIVIRLAARKHRDDLKALIEARLADDKERSTKIRLSLIEELAAFKDWDLHSSLAIDSTYRPVRVEYDPDVQRISFSTIEDARTDLRLYDSRLSRTSEILEYACAVLRTSTITEIMTVRESKPLTRMTAYLLDHHAIDWVRLF